MAKLTLSDLANLQNEATAVATLAANNAATETALENTLSRDGTSPNTMSASLDMNSNRILNLPEPVADQEPLRKVDASSATLTTLAGYATAAAAAQTAAETAQTAAETARTNAETAETNAETAETNAETAQAAAEAAQAAAEAAATDAEASAGVIGAKWAFESSTTMAAPATGGLRLNNATVSSVTAIAVHAQDAETGNPDVSNYVVTWDDSTNTTKGYLVLRKMGTPSTFAIFTIASVTDNTTWLQLAVTHVSSAGAWSAADEAVVGFTRAGDAGIDGDIAGPGVSVDGEIALYDGITGATIKRASTTGVLKAASGVLAAAVSGTDYAPATSGSGVLKGNGAGGFSTATDGTDYMSPDTTSTISVGFGITPYNGSTVSSGTYTPNPANGNYQYYTNNGAHTLANPTVDCAIDILVTNGASAGAITFTTFTVASGNTGDSLTTTNTSKFIISIRRINGTSTYVIKALQ